jgi:hypothetical protein
MYPQAAAVLASCVRALTSESPVHARPRPVHASMRFALLMGAWRWNVVLHGVSTIVPHLFSELRNDVLLLQVCSCSVMTPLGTVVLTANALQLLVAGITSKAAEGEVSAGASASVCVCV